MLAKHPRPSSPLSVLPFGLACLLPLAGCGTDLGSCDDAAARTPYFDVNGAPAYGGQALVEVSCASGQCHVETAKGAARVGAPAGLDFDMVGSREENGTDDAAVRRLKRGQTDVYEWREEVYDSVDSGWMPPGKLGADLERAAREGAAYADAAGTALPKVSSGAGKKILRNWLACGAPVVEGIAPSSVAFPQCVGGDLVGDLCAKKAVALEPTWSSIYTQVIKRECVSCHQEGSAQTTSSKLDLSGDKDTAYAALVDVDAMGDDCADSGTKRVAPGDADASNLIHKLETVDAAGDPVCGDPMPNPSTGGLSQATIDVIREWIDSGAENN